MATQPSPAVVTDHHTEVKVVKANAFRTLIHKERLLDCVLHGGFGHTGPRGGCWQLDVPVVPIYQRGFSPGNWILSLQKKALQKTWPQDFV